MYKLILTPIVVFAMVYLLASFIVMDIDARNWHGIYRALYIYASMIFLFLAVGYVIDD